MVQQGWNEGQYCGFVTAASAGAGEDAPHFTDQSALLPEATGLVEEVAHLCRHVPETCRGAEDEGVVIGKFAWCGDGGVLVKFAAILSDGLFVHGFGHAFEGDLNAIDGTGTF